jgi:hypothetical protein
MPADRPTDWHTEKHGEANSRLFKILRTGLKTQPVGKVQSSCWSIWSSWHAYLPVRFTGLTNAGILRDHVKAGQNKQKTLTQFTARTLAHTRTHAHRLRSWKLSRDDTIRIDSFPVLSLTQLSGSECKYIEMLCSLVDLCRRFWETHCLHLQDRIIYQAAGFCKR